MRRLLVLRPEPGATATAQRAEALGLDVVKAPLFRIEPLAWTPPEQDFDALMITSANAARHGGLTVYVDKLIYAVGEATASALRDAGFGHINVGHGDAATLLAYMAADGVRRALHLSGDEVREASHPQITITRIPVYRAAPIEVALPIHPGDVALLHSPRAAATFTAHVADRSRIALAAISPAAAKAAGEGWEAVAVAATPTDDAVLAVARRLCEE